MKYKYIMWDWNGTLLNDVDVNFQILNMLLKNRGLPIFNSVEKYRNMFGFPVIDFYKKAGFDLLKEKYEDVAREYCNLYDDLFPTIELTENASSVLRFFFNKKVSQLIVSASQQRLLTNQVTLHGIDHYFDEILGVKDIYGTSKVNIARAYMNFNGIDSSQVLFIGDTVHDKEVADSIGCDCVLVCCGHNSRQLLENTEAVVLDTLEEITQWVEK